ncbi:hypothetical protein [Actinoplanes palleronii]|uniref:Uncharacterized protein n=1 Tax=Actinoplanes palleronii TaxID=113570 RepID=A0ABQ4BNR5_9ACTN|nr:hypothetical protein [Actinoplanes palleronii]GIE72324.1 hypothetical protein Apa02nite_084320 [Actinoplanes palleronii]
MKRTTLLRLTVPTATVLISPAVAVVPAFAAASAAPTVTQVGAAPVVGQTTKFRFTEPDGSEPTEYRWMINGGELTGVATATAGKATLQILATRAVNQLAVYAVGADNSLSDSTQLIYTGTGPSPYADQDLNGDDKPDLAAVVGDQLLLATGKGTAGKVRVPAIDLAPAGNGMGGSGFAGLQLITGKFTGGPFEDYVAYNPVYGQAFVYRGLGEADAKNPGLLAKSAGSWSGGFFADWDGYNPTQLINAYDLRGTQQTTPDLLGVLGSAATGYHLSYYGSYGYTGGFDMPLDTGAVTPDGGSDWAGWQLASKLLPSGTAISLWNPATGALYLWEGVTADSASGRLAYTQYHLSAQFLTGAVDTTLQLTDVDADGVPDVRGVTAAGTVTAYRISGLSATGTATVKAQTPQTLR